MTSKSYNTDYNFQKKVVEHLKKQGFNCISQSEKLFPNILAWRPFANERGETLAINVQETLSDKVNTKIVLPFYVSFIECKADNHLTKKEKIVAKTILKEGRCNTFLVAYKEKRKVLFHEIKVDDEKVTMTPINKNKPSYVA